MKYIFFLLMILIAVSCVDRKNIPDGIIQPFQMQKIFWDVLQAQALSAEIAKKDSTVNEVAETKLLTQKVFEIYSIKSDDFRRSYNWYTSHPDIMLEVIDSLNNQEQRENLLELKKRILPLKNRLPKKLIE
jgi:hypothetical protein